ncbi:hypothetical protein CDAR_223761 [Caerostris darwini]|uniref:Uncharacterized protein n=1 Tax=Caerostris darwini TaxID=1538125 RepID=A0AAV4RX68_9ARAC|nr:hypothetical protein CDAR_223761 [Caerostris darwini]
MGFKKKRDRPLFRPFHPDLEKGSPILKVNNRDTALRHPARGTPGKLAEGQPEKGSISQEQNVKVVDRKLVFIAQTESYKPI